MYTIQGPTLVNIADAIRAKTGGTDELSPAEMADVINDNLENPAGSTIAIGDGVYDVANAAELVVQHDLDPDELLYYSYDASTTVVTIAVNPNATYVYDEIDIDSVLADLYIGVNERGYATPVMKGMDWFKAWLITKSFDTLAKYRNNNSKAAWYFFRRAKLAEGTTTPKQMLPSSASYVNQNGEIKDGNDNTVGSITASYNAANRAITTVYDFTAQGASSVSFSSSTAQVFSIASDDLPFGTYRAGIQVSYSGDSFTGTWPVSMDIQFLGGMESKAKVNVAAGSTYDFSVTPTSPCAGKVYFTVKTASNGMNISTVDGATITQVVTISLELLSVTANTQTAKLSDVLRYADTMTPRYALKYNGAAYPLLLIDPSASTAKGHPLDSVDHTIRNKTETEGASDITISADCDSYTVEDATGNQITVTNMKAKYAPTGNVIGSLSGRTFTYKVGRKEDADG